jgi:mannitol/fructose-specific phosphotransferase system IIA component (Ntr-type)
LRADVAAREQLLSTGIEGGIGIPHARSTGIDQPTVVFGRSTSGIDWGPPMARRTWCSSSRCPRAQVMSTCRSWQACRGPR